ncbi:uncharacterized protein LOC105699065 [Orussus abietinus]|uniref:uncharacterized protein LOC105699065 n=1 Tax=Orussus abietinus TaxID=222816 RepID=UPI0006269823|nr:uncharacterized protein LOC105699065 [Orussus abietinus]XP_012279191.1 uncharacterized protein LOC105699065 [Orussus abietinus]
MVGTAPKMSAVVVSAIRDLREVRGSTSKEIMNYISSEYGGTSPAIQRQVLTALNRGLAYGILKKVHGHYTLNSDLADFNPSSMVPEDSCKKKMKRKKKKKKKRAGKCGMKRKVKRKKKKKKMKKMSGCGKRKSAKKRKKKIKAKKCMCGGRGRAQGDGVEALPLEIPPKIISEFETESPRFEDDDPDLESGAGNELNGDDYANPDCDNPDYDNPDYNDREEAGGRSRSGSRSSRSSDSNEQPPSTDGLLI